MDYEGERKRIMREYKRIVRESQWIVEKVDAEYSLDATVFRIARVWAMGKGEAGFRGSRPSRRDDP